ncbi:MAG: RsmF rRNA methyltransferase first C-terminal domain-containing protein [Clostridia bacterium]|nr:RsmF rRNA methyltransferase first C-terminal domain-containing protein [Clostridia bacterium]
MVLPQEFLTRMQSQLGQAYPAYLAAMDEPPKSALRVNTLKVAPDVLQPLLSAPLVPVDGASDGFLVPSGFKPGADPLHAAGLYYMQEASAQAPARLLDVRPGMAVLDLCAAPGGKTTQLAAAMQNTGVLVANEYVASRAQVLLGNLERLGVTNAVVTNMDTKALCDRLAERFDAVLCDAPCAGEGMFRKDPRAVEEWSPAHVEACALRERGILDNVAKAVKPGGRLVYSTCSFSPAEDEDTTALFLQGHLDFSLLAEQKLFPHNSVGEGQYMALFARAGEAAPSVFTLGRSDKCPAWTDFAASVSLPKGQLLRLKDGRVLLVPALPFSLDGLRVVRAGLLLGEDKGKFFLPAHALALAAPLPLHSTVALTDAEAARYLSGETLPRPAEKSWCAVTYKGYALGLGKSDGTTIKNHYPKGLRWLRNPMGS